jgi:methylenetetrahydrofolate reductase (NADPH)
VLIMSAAHNYSFEFFPPKTPEGMDKLRAAREALSPLRPAFFSVTFGAGGSTRDRTLETVLDVRSAGYDAAPHLSCIGSTRAELAAILETYRQAGITRIVALRGDLPSGMAEPGELRYASELVAFIREQHGDAFHLEVAAYPEVHPQARSARDDLHRFAEKMRAGADSAITQYFFAPEAYFRFVDEAAALGVTAPIVPGIMPIGNFSQLARFSDACGADIPRWMRKRFEALGDDAAGVRALGLDIVTDLCARLLQGGAPGLHFYTLNQAPLVREICHRLEA